MSVPSSAQRETPSSSPLRDKVKSLQLPPSAGRATSSWPLGMVITVVAVMACGALGWMMGWFADPTESTTAKVAAPKTALSSNQNQSEEPSPSSRETTSSTQPATTAEPKSDGPQVAIATPGAKAKPSRKGIVLESRGYFVPARKILISPKVAGMLVQFTLQEGQRITKGEVLGVIEQVEYQADLQRTVASQEMATQRLRELQNGNRAEEIEQAAAELAEAEATMKRLDADYERAQQLIQTSNISRSEYDEVVASYQAQKRRIDRQKAILKLLKIGPREERIAQAKADLKLAEAEVIKAKWRLENCKITAPIGGIILKKNAEEGNIVNPVAMNGSFSLCEMADLSDLEVDLNIQERDVARIFVGQKCKVQAEAFPDRLYTGVVDRLMPIADRAKGAVPIRVKVAVPTEEQGVYLKPEMSAIVSFYEKDEKLATSP